MPDAAHESAPSPAPGPDWATAARRLLAENRRLEAAELLRQAIAARPEDPDLRYLLGETLANLGRLERARRRLQEAIELDPRHLDAHAALATMCARVGDAEAARGHADMVLAQVPDHPIALTALSNLAVRAGDFAEAEPRLRTLLERSDLLPVNRAVAQALLGEALHGLGRPTEALAAWQASNGLMHVLHAPRLSEPSHTRREAIDRAICHFESRPAPLGALPAAPAPVKAHAFLTGFLRSGTTLVGQVLAAHPEVVTLDEQPTLAPIARRLLFGSEGLAALATAGPSDQAAYWQAVSRLAPPLEGRTLVDKMPMDVVNLAAIARLFPHAVVILVRRDPRDVVLSCFRRTFRPNADTFRMTTLEDAARTYAQAMQLADLCLEQLPLNTHELRYEDLVADFDGEARRLCATLGLGWTEELRSFSSKAAERAIGTPSAIQLRRGLFDGGGQWRAYAGALEPVLPLLQPWIERFGYA